MLTKLLIIGGTLTTLTLMIISLWAWQEAAYLSSASVRPEVVMWSIRTASIAAGALAQIVLLICVVGNLYRTRSVDVLLRVLTAAVFAVSLVSAIALGLVGR